MLAGAWLKKDRDGLGIFKVAPETVLRMLAEM